jgi:hypothetical protein
MAAGSPKQESAMLKNSFRKQAARSTVLALAATAVLGGALVMATDASARGFGGGFGGGHFGGGGHAFSGGGLARGFSGVGGFGSRFARPVAMPSAAPHLSSMAKPLPPGIQHPPGPQPHLPTRPPIASPLPKPLPPGIQLPPGLQPHLPHLPPIVSPLPPPNPSPPSAPTQPPYGGGRGGSGSITVGVIGGDVAPFLDDSIVADEPAPSVAPATVTVPTPAAEPDATYVPVAGPTCDRILRNGCYLAMRKYSTASGSELRCTMICE